MATPNAISFVLRNPSPLTTDIPELKIQILDVKQKGQELRFTASDGMDKIRAILFSEEEEPQKIEPFCLLRIMDYAVIDIPDGSSKYLLVSRFIVYPSFGREIKRTETKNVFRLKLNKENQLSVANTIASEPNKMKLDDAILREKKVALIYDEVMLKHKPPRSKTEPENPIRVSTVWDRLKSSGITDRCYELASETAVEEDLLRIHTQTHIDWVKTTSSMGARSRLKASKEFDSIYLNEFTSEAAFLAAGCAIKAAERVASKAFNSAVAIVRPPGHHAEVDRPMGFCFFNNIAVAASTLLARRELGVKKILIVDWDVHHGNGTQQAFYNDRRVLFFSIHRYGKTFYPGTEDGHFENVGEGTSAGFNVNFPWMKGNRCDADYVTVWDELLIPIATSFDPDIVLVSAGFDAVEGDMIGDCKVTPGGFSTLLDKLMIFAEGRMVLVLEGGYTAEANANSMEACVNVLLGHNPGQPLLPNPDADDDTALLMLWKVCRKLRYYWPFLVPEQELASDSDLDADSDD